MTIIKNVNTRKEAVQLVKKVYDQDGCGGLMNRGLTFSGSVLTAIAKKTESGWTVSLSSTYYVESTLQSILAD